MRLIQFARLIEGALLVGLNEILCGLGLCAHRCSTEIDATRQIELLLGAAAGLRLRLGSLLGASGLESAPGWRFASGALGALGAT